MTKALETTEQVQAFLRETSQHYYNYWMAEAAAGNIDLKRPWLPDTVCYLQALYYQRTGLVKPSPPAHT